MKNYATKEQEKQNKKRTIPSVRTRTSGGTPAPKPWEGLLVDLIALYVEPEDCCWPDDNTTGTLPHALVYLRAAVKPGGDTIRIQRQAVRRKAKDLGATIVAEYVDQGVSRLTTDRPGLNALLRHLGGDADVTMVIMADPTRLSRNLHDALTLHKRIHHNGVHIAYLNHHRPVTPVTRKNQT